MKLTVTIIVACVCLVLAVLGWTTAGINASSNDTLFTRAMSVIFAVFVPVMTYLSFRLEEEIGMQFTHAQRIRYGID